MIVQPIVGHFSDRCTSRFGRRRPYLLLGLISVVVFECFFATARPLGEVFGDAPNHRTAGLTIAIFSFWFLDCSINVMQAPARTLLVDLAHADTQVEANSYIGFWYGIGTGVATLLGALKLFTYMPWLGSSTVALFAVSTGAIIVATCITLFAAKEEQWSPPVEDADSQNKETRQSLFISDLIETMRELPPLVKRVFMVQGFAWFGWFCFLTYATTWFGMQVYHGNPHAPEGSPDRELFNAGVRLANGALCAYALTAALTSLALPFLCHKLGVWVVYGLGQLIMAVCLMSTQVVHSPVLGFLVITLLGLSMSVTMVVPWAVTGQQVSGSSNEGVFMATMNLSQCIPQMISALVTKILLAVVVDISYALALGGVAALLAAFLVFRISRDPSSQDYTPLYS
mmetsp:Transcript_25485/g.58780  ORF Transcript_25485/g.58780 Transcript_25485/m.58780 type:complete len:399 (-) Transcript_25485:112-1308(-)